MIDLTTTTMDITIMEAIIVTGIIIITGDAFMADIITIMVIATIMDGDTEQDQETMGTTVTVVSITDTAIG